MERDRKDLTKKHNLSNAIVFYMKSNLLVGKRVLKNMRSPVQRFEMDNKLINEPIIACSESDLWNSNDTKGNWMMTAGKIQNLRIASKRLNGLEVKAGEIFSFWKHLGNPNFGKGYVIGREIREGCIIPTIGGGLCQLSNALYEAALNANFEIIERHKHTDIIVGSLAEKDRDATVKWNYVDLRLRSKVDFRIEIELTSDKLIVAYKSGQTNPNQKQQIDTRDLYTLNDCYSCGNTACFVHNVKILKSKQEAAITTYILDEKWVEFDAYVKANAHNMDYYILPLRKNKLFDTDRFSWTIKNKKRVAITTKEGGYRLLKYRFFPKLNVFKLSLELDKKVALRAAKLIPIETTHLVISQNLLPFLSESGVLGGRTFDVLMTRLPLEQLQKRLDNVYAVYNESPTLKDFRAPQELIDSENKALRNARKLITPHLDVANCFRKKTEKLEWIVPPKQENTTRGDKILFPASAVARKGAYEIRQLATELDLKLVILGNAVEQPNFWGDLVVEKFDGDWDKIGLIIYPSYFEHQPRHLLKAISKGIPIITTTACGLDATENTRIIELGDYISLKKEVSSFLSKNKKFN